MNKKVDNIYVYIWEDLNTIYIGRSKNLKSRHYQHKHRESERTYQFSSEHGVEHPKMIIIENDLTVEEGVEREKYWIYYYRNNTSYNVLNKCCGGQIGKLSTISEKEKKELQKEYYKKNKEKILEYQKKYNQIHKEKIKKYKEVWNKENKEKIAERQKEYMREYSKKNKEKLIAYKRKWNKTHKEEINKKQKEYCRKIKEKSLTQEE